MLLRNIYTHSAPVQPDHINNNLKMDTDKFFMLEVGNTSFFIVHSYLACPSSHSVGTESRLTTS